MDAWSGLEVRRDTETGQPYGLRLKGPVYWVNLCWLNTLYGVSQCCVFVQNKSNLN